MRHLGGKAVLALALCLWGSGMARAQENFQEGFHAGLSLRASFGGTSHGDWTPHLLASFGSGALLMQQSRSAESLCLMTAGDLRFSDAVHSASACDARPLVQFDLNDAGLKAANLLGLNLLKAPSLLKRTHISLLDGNTDWVQWTQKRRAAEIDATTVPFPQLAATPQIALPAAPDPARSKRRSPSARHRAPRATAQGHASAPPAKPAAPAAAVRMAVPGSAPPG